MKRFAIAIFLAALLLVPSHMYAEESDTYLVYASEQHIEQIKKQFPAVTNDFEEIPLVEMELSETDKRELQRQFSTAEIYPNQQYETAADIISPSFTAIKSTPQEAGPYTGKGVRVAVLDTGIDTEHPDLKVVDGVCTAAVCSDKIPYDDNFGHGTHVAGIIAALKNDKGTVGIAPNVELVAIKAMNSRGAGSTAQISKGVEWAIQNDIDILNLSISISVNDRPLELMLQKAYDQGIIIVSAAGNTGAFVEENNVTYPGKYSSVIAVGALNPDLTKEQNSSYGPEVELAAPGAHILSTFPKDLDIWDAEADGYRSMTGTSMAAPHVSGVLALYKEQHPGLSNIKLREILEMTAQDLGKTGRDELFGHGLVQFEKDLTAVPFLETRVMKGGIELTLKNREMAGNWTLAESGQVIPELEEGKWKLYKTKGTYEFTFSYTAPSGSQKKEIMTLEVKEPAFPDVTMDSWFAPHISYLYSHDMMSGYMDGTFKPRKEITRGEALMLIGRAQGLDKKARNTVFSDVGPHHTASGYIQSAYETGIINGFPDGSFKPGQPVTRAEMALLIQNAYKLEFDPHMSTPFTDVHSEMAAYEAIQALTQQEITVGVTETTFEPDRYMNRYSFSVFLAKAENRNLFQ